MTGAAGRAQSSHEAPSREGDLRLAEHSDTAPSAISHERQERAETGDPAINLGSNYPAVGIPSDSGQLDGWTAGRRGYSGHGPGAS